jgi:hypothetical protein
MIVSLVFFGQFGITFLLSRYLAVTSKLLYSLVACITRKRKFCWKYGLGLFVESEIMLLALAKGSCKYAEILFAND